MMAKSSLPDQSKAMLALTAEGKASNVTPTNYGFLFRCFAVVKNSPPEMMGHNINPICHSSQWGAWMAYFKAKGMSTFAAQQIGQRLALMPKEARRSAIGWLVPAEWPADFDADWTAENDKYAADRFVQAQARKRDEAAQMAEITPAEKAEVIRRAMQKMATTPKEQMR